MKRVLYKYGIIIIINYLLVIQVRLTGCEDTTEKKSWNQRYTPNKHRNNPFPGGYSLYMLIGYELKFQNDK